MGIVWQEIPVDIEQLLIWTYRDQRADVVIGMGGGLFDQEAALDDHPRAHTSADGVATIARIGALGTRVDGGGASPGHLHPDAEIVHAAVMLLPPHISGMLIRHARAASRPDDEVIPLPRPFAARDGRGRVRKGYAAWDKHKDYGWSLIAWTVAPVTAAVIRLEYAAWFRALSLLALALATARRMTHHWPLAPSAPPSAVVKYR